MANIERTLTAKKTLRKKNTAGGIFLSHFKLHHRPVGTTTVRNRHMDSRKEERAQEWTHIDVVSSWKSNQEWATRKGQSSEETGTGKLATYTKEHHWSSSRSSNRNLTKTHRFVHAALSPLSPLRWTSSQPSAGHGKRLLRPHFSLLQCLPAGALRQPCSSQPGCSPIIQKPESWRSWGNTAPASWSPSPVWRQSVLRPRVRVGFGAPCRPPEKSRQPRAHRPQRAHPETALLWALRLEAQTEMEQNSSMTLLKTWLGNNESLYGMQP